MNRNPVILPNSRIRFLQARPPFGMMTPPTGSDPLNHPPDALVSLKLTLSQASKIGLGDRWQIARRKIVSRARNQADAKTRLQRSVQDLLHQAQTNEWSQRRLARETGISWAGWIRCRTGKGN